MAAKHYKDFTVKLSVGEVDVIQGSFEGLAIKRPAIVVNEPSVDSEHKWSKAQNLLDTWIHETAHLSQPNLSEAEVARLANDITKVLWNAGYRRIPKTK